MIYKGIQIRPAEEEDRLSILNLLNNVFSENQRSTFTRGGEFWHWKFRSNVFEDSILTIAEHEDEIIGTDHLWPWQLQCRGVKIKASQPCDSAVAPKYRGRGIFKQLRIRGIKKAMKKNHQLLFNFPNQNSLPANLKLGAQYLGKISWWVKVLRPVKMAIGAIGNKPSSAADIDDKFKLDIPKLDEIAQEYEIFDQFLGIDRKTGFHEWRYQNRPNRQYGMVSLQRNSKMIVALFTMNKKGTSREMVLVDVIGEANLSEYLFNELVDVARYLDATFLALMDNYKFGTKNLWKKGFIKKKMKNMVVLPVDLAIEAKVTNIANWSLVAGMHDSI